MSSKFHPHLLLISAIAATITACAMMPPAEVTGPRAGGQPYPILVTDQPQRRESSVLAINRLYARNEGADQSTGYLQPVTATVKSLPMNLATPLYLPKVGSSSEMTEEEIRESLRRFIGDWQTLIGAAPAHLSLVERIDQKDGTKIAKYEQRAFRYPLRGDYGRLEIHFTPDRRLLNVSSSCIPEAERLQPTFSAIVPHAGSEDVIMRLRANGITYIDPAGKQQTYQLSASNEITATDLVIYVRPSTTRTDTLELRLTWEIMVTNAPVKTVHVDAVEDEIVAAQ